MIKTFKSIFAKELDNIAVKTKYGDLERCLRFILAKELEKPSTGFSFTIPCAIINLIILDAFTLQELTNSFSKLFATTGECCQMGVLIFRCHLILDWLQFKSVSEYSDFKVEVTCLDILKKIMKNVKKRKENKELVFILKQIRLCLLK